MHHRFESRLSIIPLVIVFLLTLLTQTVIATPLADSVEATLFQTPRALTPFQLQSTQSTTPFTQRNLQGKWSLLFFGFTRCGYLCPTTMAALNLTYQQLQAEHLTDQLQVILVTIDPERDQLSDLKKYVTAFNPCFIGLRGDEQQLTTLKRQMGVIAVKNQDSGKADQDYQIDHSGAILIINPKGQVMGLFNLPHRPDHMAKDFKTIVTRAST